MLYIMKIISPAQNKSIVQDIPNNKVLRLKWQQSLQFDSFSTSDENMGAILKP